MSVLKLLFERLANWERPTESEDRDESINPLIDYLQRNPEGRIIHRWVHYFDIYHRHFARFRGEPITIVEIGIFNGGSLPMWKEYFGPASTIVGVDINPGCERFAEPGVEIVIGDQGDRSFLTSLAQRYSDIAILIDDGGHQMHQQVATFEELYPRMRADGVYLCEDTHTSYMAEFGGAFRDPNTFIELMKSLVDRLHAFHSPTPDVLRPDDFTLSTDSMHFYDSVVVIEKRQRTAPPHSGVFGKLPEFTYVAASVSGT